MPLFLYRGDAYAKIGQLAKKPITLETSGIFRTQIDTDKI